MSQKLFKANFIKISEKQYGINNYQQILKFEKMRQ